jgi:hypothetical protein
MFSGTTWIIVAIPKIPIGLTAARRICFFETYSKQGFGYRTDLPILEISISGMMLIVLQCRMHASAMLTGGSRSINPNI